MSSGFRLFETRTLVREKKYPLSGEWKKYEIALDEVDEKYEIALDEVGVVWMKSSRGLMVISDHESPIGVARNLWLGITTVGVIARVKVTTGYETAVEVWSLCAEAEWRLLVVLRGHILSRSTGSYYVVESLN
jgi:hypothetical protein